MSKNTKYALIILGAIVFLWVFVRPPVVKMYCQKQKDDSFKVMVDDIGTRESTDMIHYNQNDLSQGNEALKASDMRILGNKYDNELKQDQQIVNQGYSDCLHGWGD